MEELTPTQINAYVLEICKAQKEELKSMRGPEITLGQNAKLDDFKKLGIVVKKAKNGRR